MALDDHTIGVRIRRFRKERGITQQILAELSNQEPSNISHIERGACLFPDNGRRFALHHRRLTAEKADIHIDRECRPLSPHYALCLRRRSGVNPLFLTLRSKRFKGCGIFNTCRPLELWNYSAR